jgi:hypothetical protein
MKTIDKSIQKTTFTLDRFEEEKAVLLDEKNQEIVLQKNMLPKGIKDGAVLVITIATDGAETSQREKKAKEILNEIMKVSDSTRR